MTERSILTRKGIFLFICFLFTISIMGPIHNKVDAKSTTAASSNEFVYVIPVKHTIESGLEKFIRRAIDEAHEDHAKHIIFELNTFGGTLGAADGIGKLIRDSAIPTTVFVQGKALSAGSYIALNADQIYMQPGSSIGSAAIVDITGERVNDSKTISAWVGMMTAAANLNDRNPEYAAGMVDDQLVVHVEELGKTYGVGTLINFNAQEALQAGYAEGIAANRAELLQMLGLDHMQVIEVNITPAEHLARWLTHPVVSTLLLLIGLAGIAIELFVPGFGVPGMLGIAAFILYFFGHYITGFAGIEHILLFIAGVVLLVIEIFVPSFGLFGIAGIICLFCGVVLAAYDTGRAMLSLGTAILCTIVVLAILTKYFKHRGIWNRFILRDKLDTESGYTSQTTKDHYLGKKGKSITPLRPAGTALIDGERVDVVTSGEYIEANKDIEVIQVEGTRVVVRKVNIEK